MFHCSNKTCNTQFTNEAADKLKGDCSVCGAPLANETNLGWRHLDGVKKLEVKAGVNVQSEPAKAQPVPAPVPPVLPPPVVPPSTPVKENT